MPSRADCIGQNLASVHQRIEAAAARGGRGPDQIRLVAVTKYVDAATARELVEAGCCDLGESRPQELWHKAAALADLPIRWHQIGHLQRNKARRTVPHLAWLHAGDSQRLLDAVNQATMERPQPLPTLLEVNVSGETAKHGFQAAQLLEVLEQISSWPHLQVCGLMAMAGMDADPDTTRRQFAELRQLREQLQGRVGDSVRLSELSMGMSHDFEIAIEEGATIVRVGSALFEALP